MGFLIFSLSRSVQNSRFREWSISFICLVSLATQVLADQLEPGADPWFASHIFVGMDGCLAARGGQRLEHGDSVFIFEAGKPVMTRRISYVISGDSAKQIFDERRFDGVYRDKALWNRIGCYWGLRSCQPPFSLARYETADSAKEGGLPLAIEGLPASALKVGGDGRPLDRQELGALEHRVTAFVPKEFSRGKVLRVGRRFGSGLGHDLMEVFLGRPFYDARGVGAPIDSIEICHLFMHNGRVLAVERYSRVSGQEEHVDVEPTQLDESNWFLGSVETLGFLSVDGGRTWDRISIDVGFEGISWAISRLTEGLPQLWEFSLYTSH